MSEVYQAKSSDIRRPLAVKRLIVGSVDGEERLAEFVRETAVVASLDHPNIVGVIDAGEHHDDFVLVMEYVDGVSVLDILTYLRRHKDRLDVELTCGIVGQVARGLSHAHDRTLRDGTPLGIVHRNVTPPNIFVTRSGVPKLLDFGMATLEGHEVTMPGVVRGTDDYLSPEQARGEKVDPRTDVFCLGAVAYELLSGRSFYPRPADRDLMRIQAGDLEPIAPRLAGVDPDLVDIIVKATSPRREDRFSSARGLERRLDSFRAARGLRVDTAALAQLVGKVYPEVDQRRKDARGTAKGELQGILLRLPPDSTGHSQDAVPVEQTRPEKAPRKSKRLRRPTDPNLPRPPSLGLPENPAGDWSTALSDRPGLFVLICGVATLVVVLSVLWLLT